MQQGWEAQVRTGHPGQDAATVDQYRRAAEAQGMRLDAQPMPGGGFFVRATPAAQGGWGPQQQQQGWGNQQGFSGGQQAQSSQMAGWGNYGQGASSGYSGPSAAVGTAPLSEQKVAYLRKVYGLLAGAAAVAIACGFAMLNVGGTVMYLTDDGKPVAVPTLVAAMLDSPVLLYGSFILLFVGTIVASAVSRKPGINVVALFGVSALMGIELAPMVFIAQAFAGLGQTMSLNPVRDAFALVGAIFLGVTAYVFTTRKDFSYLKAILHMGFWVVFAACLLSFVFDTEAFSLAVATVGALLAAGFLLYNTSRILHNSDMDNPVGDALGLIVQLRNLFMFILRILMSSRR